MSIVNNLKKRVLAAELLITVGITVEKDMRLLDKPEYGVNLWDE
ncbi:MAG: hypothetical protein PHE79_01200 [Eubacteriales bacterium]|nr:hypothetical protein [Eubacteriales bacterium]